MTSSAERERFLPIVCEMCERVQGVVADAPQARTLTVRDAFCHARPGGAGVETVSDRDTHHGADPHHRSLLAISGARQVPKGPGYLPVPCSGRARGA